MKLILQLFPLLALALHVHAHGVLTAVTGTNGVNGQGFGVIASTPRDGTKRNPFQQDTSIIRDQEIKNGNAGVCGRTLAGGNNDVSTQLDAAVSAGLPSADASGTVSMTLHQVNGDGAGPYTCEVSTDATGTSFAAMTVTTNVPGQNSRSNAKATDFALVAQMPAGATCTGGANADACLVRCRNSAAAGPFGGCVAVSNAGSANATASNATADASATESTADDANATETDSSVETAADTASLTATDSAAAVATSPATSPAASSATASSNTGADSGSTESDTDPAEDATSTAKGNTSKAKSVAAKLGLFRSRLARDTNSEDEDDTSIHDAELALAADLDRRFVERVRRSRITGHRTL